MVELQNATEASKATFSRLLGDFESRGWVARDGNRYALTPLGEYVASAFVDLYDHMTTATDLRELLPWFPLAELDVEWKIPLSGGLLASSVRDEDCPCLIRSEDPEEVIEVAMRHAERAHGVETIQEHAERIMVNV